MKIIPCEYKKIVGPLIFILRVNDIGEYSGALSYAENCNFQLFKLSLWYVKENIFST